MRAIFRSLMCVALAMLALAPVSDKLHGAEASYPQVASQSDSGPPRTIADDGHASDHSHDRPVSPATAEPHAVSASEDQTEDHTDGHTDGHTGALSESAGHCHPGLDCFSQAVVLRQPLVTRSFTGQNRNRPVHPPVLAGRGPVSDPPPPRDWS